MRVIAVFGPHSDESLRSLVREKDRVLANLARSRGESSFEQNEWQNLEGPLEHLRASAESAPVEDDEPSIGQALGELWRAIWRTPKR